MQPVHMPVTPLAVRMHGGAAAQDDLNRTPLDPPVLAPGPEPAALRPHPVSRTPDIEGRVFPEALVREASSTDGDKTFVVRYASRDASGRVWGVPSAFGAGQCLECPARCAPPSTLCVACQYKAGAEGDPMPEDQLRVLQSSLGSLLVSFSGKPGEREDVTRGLGQLYSKAQAGRLPPSIQVRLAGIANAIDANAIGFASREVTAISATHWTFHKDWIVGLKRLLSRK